MTVSTGIPHQTSVPEAGGRELPAGPPSSPAPGPIAQSVAIGFRSVHIAAALLVALWLSGNVRQITPDNQAVVRRFGSIVGTQESGLLLAWPRPIEEVQILPGREQQLSQDVSALDPPTQQSRALIGAAAGNGALPPDVSAYLTGDGNVVLLSATLIYQIEDPIAYALSQRHIAPALQRLFRAAAVRVTAGKDLGQFLVTSSPAVQGAGTGAVGAAQRGVAVTTLRAGVRDHLLQEINSRLEKLASAHVSLGIRVDRVDMTAWLPPQAKSAFDQVLLAAQAADREVADARTEAERRRQGAGQLSERLIASAQASAGELLSNATVDTAGILALEREETAPTRNSLLLHQYRSRMAEILKRVGTVKLVDPRSGARFLMPGIQARPPGPPSSMSGSPGGQP